MLQQRYCTTGKGNTYAILVNKDFTSEAHYLTFLLVQIYINFVCWIHSPFFHPTFYRTLKMILEKSM